MGDDEAVEPNSLGSIADKLLFERTPLSERWTARNTHEQLRQTAARHGDRPALSFQLKSGPSDPAETLNWRDVLERVNAAANLFRRLGVGEGDAVAYLLPNCNEAAIVLLAGQTAGVVAPINPLLEPDHIASLLRETGAKVLVTLAPFVKTELNAHAIMAAAEAPCVETIVEVDLARYLTPPVKWLIPALRPKRPSIGTAKILNFEEELARERSDALDFEPEAGPDTISAVFHTGGTTGMPKLAPHRQIGMLYNGWLVDRLIYDETSVVLCPMPLFHCFGAYPMWIACVASGAHMVMPTPAGYRGDGVMDNFWKLIERWRVTFLTTVPTAAGALMQRPVNADVSSLEYAICGSAPLPRELFRQFEESTGVTILEGYGQTETTCLISCNPIVGERKLGSVGLPMPYTDVRILHMDQNGAVSKECPTDEVGEICIKSPAVFPGYTDAARNDKLFVDDEWLRTGDLGRLDVDGYLWITGRAKDVIIRGGHNIDPAVIEEALAKHPDVAVVGAIGQPDAYSGEKPCAYVELCAGAAVTGEDLKSFAAEHIGERAAIPTYVEILPEVPKTAVGKIFKPALRKSAIARVYEAALAEAGVDATVTVAEDSRLGLVAEVASISGDLDEETVGEALGPFARPWRKRP